MAMAFRAAGHHFEQTPNGIRCTSLCTDGQLCDAQWSVVRCCTQDDIAKPRDLRHHSHVGELNLTELSEIYKVRAEEEAAVWEAVIFAASAGSR